MLFKSEKFKQMEILNENHKNVNMGNKIEKNLAGETSKITDELSDKMNTWTNVTQVNTVKHSKRELEKIKLYSNPM